MLQHNTADRAPARARWLALAVLAALAVLLIYLLGKSEDDHATSTAGTSSPASSPAAGGEAARRGIASSAGGAVSPTAPVIDSITVEKPEVCEGEENLITVKAHDPGGNDGALRSLVHGAAGWSVPLRTRDNTEDPDAPPRSVTVINDQGESTTVAIPHYKINNCPPAVQLRLRPFLLANSSGEYRLEARLLAKVAPGRPKPDKFVMDDFKPTRYEWDFGDGETATTTQAYVTHDYQYRDQHSHFSYYLLAVKATDDRGRTLVARDSLEIMNPAYEELAYKGIVKIMTQQAPRFPVLDNGKVTQVVRVWHFDKEPIVVDRILAYYYGREGKEMGSAPVPAAALLGTDGIPAHSGLRIQVVLDTVKNPEIGFITYDIQGTTKDGKHAMGTFSIMRPPDAPTREKNIPVTDGMLAAKILKAKELLGKELVTDEDLWELERQGKFVGLQPVQVAPQPSGPPSWLPRPPRSDHEPWSSSDDPGPYEPQDPAYVPEQKGR